MSVHKHPREWAREMDMMMGNGTINKDNYLTDCANAVVYVRESADRIAKLEAELTASREQWRTMACPECATVASLTAERNAFIAALLDGCEDVPEHLRGITAADRLRVLRMDRDTLKADRDRLAQEVRDVNQRLGEAWEKLRELEGKANQ